MGLSQMLNIVPVNSIHLFDSRQCLSIMAPGWAIGEFGVEAIQLPNPAYERQSSY
jgi:hypothetical protein